MQSGSSNLGLERIDAAAQAVRIALRDGEPASDLCSQLALVCDEFFMQFGCENMTIQGCKQALEA
ncbi:MAG: hypothetical protein IPK63_23120 [Candidatus Competibacteraceae bacterium]|nr:hypothetical protein [Candidatus Competibacteraceae bacterium]